MTPAPRLATDPEPSTVDEPTAPDPTPAAPDGQGTPERVEPDQGTPHDPVVELPFDINEVENEEHRRWLLGRQAQMQAGVTKLVQSVRERERELAKWDAYQQRLTNEEQRLAALSELAAEYGVELEFDEGEPLDDDSVGDELYDPQEERLAALEAAEQRREQAQREEQFRHHVYEGLSAYAAEEGLDSVEAIPEDDRDDILRLAATAERTPDGLLDLEGAVTLFRARQAARAERIRQRYLQSKDAPRVVIGGTSADPAVDLTDPAQRRARAEAIAARHVA